MEDTFPWPTGSDVVKVSSNILFSMGFTATDAVGTSCTEAHTYIG